MLGGFSWGFSFRWMVFLFGWVWLKGVRRFRVVSGPILPPSYGVGGVLDSSVVCDVFDESFKGFACWSGGGFFLWDDAYLLGVSVGDFGGESKV